MKILWVSPNFLHPTTKGGQIRTLEMLRELHSRHEIHYATLDNPNEPEGRARCGEYCSEAIAVPHQPPPRRSLAFASQAAQNLFSNVPLAVERYASAELRGRVDQRIATGAYDRIVCDFLAAAPNISRLDECVLFQHNVETVISERQVENASNAMERAFFQSQTRKMSGYERKVCRDCRHVIAVSETDAARMRKMFGIESVSEVPTGVDLKYFAPPTERVADTDLIFVGSMDWLPNIDGMRFFVAEILPRIRKQKPDCTLTIAGRRPPDEICAFAEKDPHIRVTGTVDDIRPFLWRSSISIVPLRIGGGTRLKIFESMAARVPVVSTAIGAEGLPVQSGRDCFLADQPEDFAARCVELLGDIEKRRRMEDAAWELVSTRFSWAHAARCFEEILESAGARSR